MKTKVVNLNKKCRTHLFINFVDYFLTISWTSKFSTFWIVNAVDIVHTVDTLDIVKSVNSVDNVSSVNSVHNVHNASHWPWGWGMGHPKSPRMGG